MAQPKIFTNQNTMHYNGDTQMADINQQEREEFQALIRGHGESPRSFTASAGVQSDPVGGFTPVGQAIGAGIDTVSNIAKNTADALSTIASTPINVKNADGTETVSPFGQQGSLLQSIGQLGQSLPNALPAGFVSNTDRLFLYNNEQLRANEALRIAKTLNIGADTVMFGDDRAFERADYLSRRVERGQVLQDIYDEFPELYKVKYSSQAEGIQALNNLESIKNTKGVFDAMQQSIWAMNDQMKLGDVGFALAHESDPQKISELTDEVNRLQNNLQSYRTPDGSSPLEEIFGATSSQGYMMAKQGGLGAVAGAVAGALIGGLATEGVGAAAGAATGAKWGGGADMAYNMYKMSFGNKYVELIQKKDANGNRVYTDQEANQYAMSYAAIDASIEFAATAAMGKAFKAVAPKGVIAKAISAGVGDTVKTFDRGIGTTVAQMAKNSIKAGVPELFEEGLQDVNEKVQHNLTRKDNDLEGYYSVGDIAIGSLDAMKQALPAVIGFGAIGGAVGGARTAKAFRDFQKLTPEQQQAAIIAEQNRNGAVIMDNVRKDSTTNKIAKENPELYGKIVQAQGDKVGVSTQYVDVAELVQSENGQLAIRDMVDNGLVTQEEVKAAIEADAPVEIPIGSYAQVSMNLSDETVDALKQTSYFTRGGMSLATLERAKQEVDVAKSVLKDDTSKRAERIKDDIIRNEFDGASDVDREVLNEVLSDPTNIKRNFNNLLHTLKEKYRETYASDFDNSDKSINDAVSTGIEPQWLTDYKANNGGKAPRTNAERRRAAYEYSRATTTESLDGNADALAQSDAHYADMEHMLMQIESLEAMKDKVFELANNDIALRMQLSKSGYDVYNEVVKAISESTNRKQRETAKANALLMAQHADIMAKYMRQMGKGGYTAMDYFRDSVRINMNAVLDNQKGYNQNTKAVWESKLDKVLSDWANNVDNANNIGSKKTIDIMDPPLVFKLINLDLKKIKITGGVLHKILRSPVFDSNGKRILSGHNDTVSIDMLKQLPNTIANPSAIFSADNGKKIIIITEVIGLNGKPIMMPILLNKYNNRGDYHVVQSYYARNTNIAYYDLLLGGDLIYINKERLSNNPKNQPPWLGGIKLSRSFINSIPNETDLDNLRKKHNYQYYQAAWHGSPHDFDTFDLGAIGTGEGNQAHGWGLYFAKNREVAQAYKDVLGIDSVEIISGDTKYRLNDDIEWYDNKTKSIIDAENPLSMALTTLSEEGESTKAIKNLTDFIKSKKDNKSDYVVAQVKRAEQAIQILKDNHFDTHQWNTMFEVDIPENEYLLNEQENIEKQSPIVKKAVSKISNELNSSVLNNSNLSGKEFYKLLSKELGGDRLASKYLNEHGIKGITYEGVEDGRCYVVFDDKAIKVIKKYNQSVNGMTEIMKDGERIISIFKTADRSTFLHEMGHVFFDDIQKLASMENAPEQLVTDWNKLKEWSGWVDGENVDNTKAHEKFARGWESYLRSGEAPTSALQRVFRQFSKWLTYIYRSVQRLGGEVPADIKDVMARMIATQEDIEAYAEQQQLEQFEKTELYKQLSEQDQARMQSYIADVKEKAKERVMRKLMKELDNRPIKEWEEEKDAIQIEIEKRLIEQYPIYKEHQRYNVFGAGALKDTQYNSIEELEKAEVEQTGATFNDAIKQEMDNAKAEFMKDNNADKTNEQIAEEILLSTQGQMRLTEEESKIIQKSTNRELAKNWELLERIRKLDPNTETIDTELSEIEKEVKPTKYDELKADKKKVDAALTDATKELEKAEDRIKRLEDALQDRINNVRSIRGAGLGTISDYMNRARKELGELPISNAVQFKMYQNKAVTAGKNADRALASGKVDKALGYKREQMLQQARARVAFENFEKSKKLRLKLKQQLQRMTRPKNPITIEPNMRYFYAHMAYQMGLTKYDGLAPTDGFDMNTVLSALDVDALILNQQSMVQLQPWIAELFYSKTPKSFKSITMNELETLEELMTGMYKNGRNEYEGTTILNDEGKSVSFENAVQEIIGEATETFGGATGDVFNILNNQTKTDAVSGKLYGFHLALMKVETFLRRMGGGKNGFAVKYIYDPISRATQAFNERKEVSMRRLAKDVGIYSKRELFDMRNDHLYTVGNLYGLTKEQLIMIALNWGTESNRQRVMETTKANEVEIERAFQEHMTDKDWEFVIRTWDHINSFFDERSKVQEELYGNPLKKVEGLTFSIGGRNIEGQYFPIVYNPKVNASVSDNQVEDIAKTMVSSNAVWGTGMSATKSRLDVVKDKSLLLDFDVIPNAITEAINHVTMRKAVTDVNKLISNRELQNYIVDKFGADTYQFLRTWVRDNWQDEAAKTNDIDRLILTLKKNTLTAVMAGRVSVALQNALNIPVAFYRIGVGNTIRAINHAGIGFYGHGTTTYNNTRDFVLGQSIFMRERIQTLDKDLKQGLSIAGKGLRLGDTNVGGYKVEQLANVRDDINQMGFRLLTETDFALSIPVWKFAYDQKQAELFGKEGVSAEWVEQQSIEAGDRAVRDIFGSGDTKDAAAIQRSRSTFTQLFVPFYSYANTLYNIITEGNYARKDNGDYARFVKMLWWTLISQAIGTMAYKAMTNGDDDKPEDLAKSFIEELVSQGTMGVPIVRDISNMAMKYILGEKVFNKGNSVMALSIVEKFYDLGNAIMSKNKDGIDVGRSFSQLANRATGFSDTVTDGLWTLAKFGFTDTDASLEDAIMAVVFDRRLKTKKDKKKH
uniref:Crystallin beta/gamma motif-containing protein n=1 Tax=Podoviridae sp. ctCmm1 TaxID=2825231 RepID=A0A8S5TUP6_9CAUD|nr:MAG TPA: crystallin beta/gamma motif-containing protein [Podoviridae sp. ctCmm1]